MGEDPREIEIVRENDVFMLSGESTNLRVGRRRIPGLGPMKCLVTGACQSLNPPGREVHIESEDASTRERKFPPLGQTRGIGERLTNILVFKIREVVEQAFDGSPRCKRLDDHANSDAHAPDTRLAAHNLGISGYPAEPLHAVRIALNPAYKRRAS